jgi:hypothetical protein
MFSDAVMAPKDRWLRQTGGIIGHPTGCALRRDTIMDKISIANLHI